MLCHLRLLLLPEVLLHNLTHLPYRTWSALCERKRQGTSTQKLTSRTPTVQLHYQFITQATRKLKDEKPTGENSRIQTVLCAVDTLSRLGLEVIVGRKGNDKIAETELVKFLIDTGRANCTLLGDNEPALIYFTQRVVKKLCTSATYRTTANCQLLSCKQRQC